MNKNINKVDLHMHTTASDGALTPQELIKECVEFDLEVFSVTDHDNTTALKELEKEAAKYPIEFVPGIEISTYRGEAEYHILGYYIDPENEALLGLTETILDSRITRVHKMVEILSEMGYPLEYSDVQKYAAGVSIGRPHVARALVEKGYVDNIGEAFTDQFIGGEGKAYVAKEKVLPAEAIEVILKAGGVPVIAHPYLINHGDPLDKEEIARLKNVGLKGVEVYQSKHDKKTTAKYKKIAEELDLLITGGSDYHGENSPGILPGDCGMNREEFRKLESFAASMV
ncbi:PHP domain-containing protein [Halanaerobium sp. Z-7514]|uniref:PHP domain-containing protein n=1 Tax=Halanaerobium polyolivorans TaxID=2886943 RepID=A0AAW4WTP7_9FIRM|nr:PHP domain-containing protein [Halanaerobium polyolivorans]MCC3144366.1 PHP domain-containing protein [Halanaerobium polyolivorans]